MESKAIEKYIQGYRDKLESVEEVDNIHRSGSAVLAQKPPVMKRGEIWWADSNPLSGRRPVLLLSRDEAYYVRELITVAPATTLIRHIPSEVPLDIEDS